MFAVGGLWKAISHCDGVAGGGWRRESAAGGGWACNPKRRPSHRIGIISLWFAHKCISNDTITFKIDYVSVYIDVEYRHSLYRELLEKVSL